MGYFKLKKKTRLVDIKEEDKLPESDYAALTEDGTFVQLEHVSEDTPIEPYEIKPGIFTIKSSMAGMYLEETHFANDHILETFDITNQVVAKIDKFFNRLHVYAEHGIDVPKRNYLLYGPPGSGKSTIITKVAKDYVKKGNTAMVIWPSDKFEAYDVKSFIKRFNYGSVERLILVIEDLGGIEKDDIRVASESSLLSLLDNVEKTFTKPTAIFATTNHPHIFLGNLTNRPQRFDEKIEVALPNGEQRASLLRFFSKKELPDDIMLKIKDKKYTDFTPAHLKELIIRSAIEDQPLIKTLEEMYQEIEKYKKGYSNQKDMAMGSLGL